MKPDFNAILDECLALLKAGEDVQSCLAEYPDQAEHLRPLLAAAAFVRDTPAPRARPDAFLAGQQRMLQASLLQHPATTELVRQKQREEFHDQAISFRPLLRYTGRVAHFLKTLLIGKEQTKMKFVLRLAIDLAVIMVIGSIVTVNASARSLPGDPTYGVKRAWEQVRLSLTLDERARQSIETLLAEERRKEIQALMQIGRQETVEFSGLLERIEGDQWIVGGLTLQMSASTTIEGAPAVGQFVRVLAHVQNNGTLRALHVGLEPHHGPSSGEHAPYPTPGIHATPYPTQPAHTPEHTYDPTHTAEPAHHIESTQTAAPTHHTEPPHDAGSGRKTEPAHQLNPTQHVEPLHQPEPTQHEEPRHDPGSGHPTDPPHGGHE